MVHESKQNYIDDLLRKIRHVPLDADNNDVVHQAVEKLRSEGWLTDGSLARSYLKSANFRNVQLMQANLSESNLIDASLVAANLIGATLRRSKLISANLSESNSRFADFRESNLTGAQLRKANLGASNLTESNLRLAKLQEANLIGANLTRVNLENANLTGANLALSDLRKVRLSWANMQNTNLEKAYLKEAYLLESNLNGANMKQTRLDRVAFIDVDLSSVKGLGMIQHEHGSTLSQSTLLDYDRLPDMFLKGCGFPEAIIAQYDLLRGESKQFYDVYIIYSPEDSIFALRLYTELKLRGVKCWIDEHDLVPGQPIDAGISEGIKNSEKTIFCCSEYSLNNDLVNDELTITFNEERKLRQEEPASYRILPIDLDGKIFNEPEDPFVTEGKRDKIINRKMLDMRNWDDLSTDDFNARVEKLVDALRRDPSADE